MNTNEPTKSQSKRSNTGLKRQFEEVQLIYKNRMLAKDRPRINSPAMAYDVLKEIWNMDQIELLEEFMILLLDRRMKVMSFASISKGGYAGTVVDPKIIFAIALKRRTSGIILAHNHPSGNTLPSREDLTLTEKIKEAGKVLDITVIDHLIITKDSYRSLQEENYL